MIIAFSLFHPYGDEQNGHPPTHLLGYFALKLTFKAVLNSNFETYETDSEWDLYFLLHERVKLLLYPEFCDF